MSIDVKIHNRFDIEVTDINTGEIRQKAQAENIVLDSLWSRLLGSSSGYFSAIAYGSGTGTPDPSRTTLFKHVAAVSVTSETIVDNDPITGVHSARRAINIQPETSVGVEITEVGIASGTSGAILTHAMLKDMNGVPISIVKKDTDLITIYATVYAHVPPEGFDNGHITLLTNMFDAPYANAVVNTMLGIAVDRNVHGGHGLPYTTVLSFSDRPYVGGGANSSGYSSSDIPNKRKMYAMTSLPSVHAANGKENLYVNMYYYTTSGNSGHYTPIYSLKVGGSWFPGTQILGETIATGDGIKKSFTTEFTLPESAKVYVNGVLQTSGVTVRKIPDFTTDMAKYLHLLHPSSTDDVHVVSFTRSTSPATLSIYYNPFYELGLASWGALTYSDYGSTVSVSNNLIDWEVVTRTDKKDFNIPVEYRYYKYWKLESYTRYNHSLVKLSIPEEIRDRVLFDVAPEVGAVITMDYFTKSIAKNTDYLVSLDTSLSFGEKEV